MRIRVATVAANAAISSFFMAFLRMTNCRLEGAAADIMKVSPVPIGIFLPNGFITDTRFHLIYGGEGKA